MSEKSITNEPQFDYSAIDNSGLADTTKKKYQREIDLFLRRGGKLADTRAVAEYARGLNLSSRAFLKAAIRLMTEAYEDELKASATPDNVKVVQASLWRLEALRGAVKVEQPKGTKAHTWLSGVQVSEITEACGDDLEGKRDWIVLGLMLGAGLRREELVSLTFDALKLQPKRRGGMRNVLEVKGKGAKSRVIPIKPILAKRLREWRDIVGGGLIARSLGRSKELGESMSAVAVFHIVRKYGERIGIENLAPHDCRRTFAQLGFDAGIPITQISQLLGHASIDTTKRYLNLELDLDTTISDFIPLVGD